MILVRAQPGGRAAEMRAGAARLTQCLERGQTAEAVTDVRLATPGLLS